MRALKRLILGVLLLTFTMAAVAYALPREVSVERSVALDAPESDVFPFLNEPRKFNRWSPWATRDPEAHHVFSGPERGEGARVEWDSDRFGAGSRQIVESVPAEKVVVALDFDAHGPATAIYTLSPAGAGTRVTWRFRTNVGNNPVMRWSGLLFDRWIGKDYQRGLNELKRIVEAADAGE